MNKEFLIKVAKHHADETFDKKYLDSASDSWYYEEKAQFEEFFRIGADMHKPTEEEVKVYMDALDKAFHDKCNELYCGHLLNAACKDVKNDVEKLISKLSNLMISDFVDLDESHRSDVKVFGEAIDYLNKIKISMENKIEEIENESN